MCYASSVVQCEGEAAIEQYLVYDRNADATASSTLIYNDND